MKLHCTLLAAALVLASSQGAAAEPTPLQSGLLPVPANRIVGFWHAQVSIGPCAGGPVNTFLGLNTFMAGGTLSDTNTFQPTSRGPGMGVWTYLGRGRHGESRYKNHFQFARFKPDGSFDGLQDVYNDITLQADAKTWTANVHAYVLNVDGSVRVEACGSALANRITLN